MGEQDPPYAAHIFPDFKFIAFPGRFVAGEGGFHQADDLRMVRDGWVKAVQLHVRVLQNRGDVPGGQDAVFLASQKGGEEKVLFLDAHLVFGAAGHVEDAGF